LVGRLRAPSLAIPNAQVLAWELGRLVGPVVRRLIPDPQGLSPSLLSSKWKAILVSTVSIAGGATRALEWIAACVRETAGRQWTDQAVKWLVVDASMDRAGAKLGSICASIPFPDWMVEQLQGNQSRREVQGALLGLQAFSGELEGQRVVLMSDNKGQVSVFNQMRNGALAPWVAEALWFCLEHQIDIHRASWIPAREMVRRGVDGLSRMVDVNDWTLKPQLWQIISAWAPGLQVDRFADSLNAKLPRWNSRFREPGGEAVDSLVQDWRGVRNYACPPLSMIGRVIDLVRCQRACSVLVVPVWVGQVWWPMLTRMATQPMDWLSLGQGPVVFDRGRSGKGAPLQRNWEFMAVKLFWI
jgi:hypothetical protein